jgi:RNA polymerase sigma-70 factor (ECF subfamily)
VRFEQVDIALLEACRAGDVAAFERLCHAVEADLYGFLFSLLRDHDATDEALQECLVRLYRHLPGLRDLERFPGWLMKMAVNQCRTVQARARIMPFQPLEEGIEYPNEQVLGNPHSGDSPPAVAQRAEMMAEVDAAIATLPPRQRAAIVLFEIEDHSISEIAEILECSEGAVKFNLHEARKKLREALRHHLPHCKPGAS